MNESIINKQATKTIIKHNYEYLLVKVGDNRHRFGVEAPSFMGNYGWALKSFKKVKKSK